jgi:hypothetical protein
MTYLKNFCGLDNLQNEAVFGLKTLLLGGDSDLGL